MEIKFTPLDNIENWFSYHAPTPEQLVQYNAVRDAAKAFARVIEANTPRGADQTATFRKLRETMMSANAAIACHLD